MSRVFVSLSFPAMSLELGLNEIPLSHLSDTDAPLSSRVCDCRIPAVDLTISSILPVSPKL